MGTGDLLSGFQGAQDENRLLAFLKHECPVHGVVLTRERNAARQPQAQSCRLEYGAMFSYRRAMRRTRIIEGWPAYHPKGHRPPHDFDAPNQLILPGRFAGQSYRHEIFQFADAVRREKAGDQHIGFRPIELFRPDVLSARADLEPPALLVVQDGGKDARRIEEGHTDQSIEPFIPTSAAVRILPMMP